MARCKGDPPSRSGLMCGLRKPHNVLRERSGHALIEAALIFPVLVGLFLGVSEFSEALTVNRRLQTAASTAADLVARLQTVDAQDLDGIKGMMDEIVKPYSVASLGLIVSSVIPDAKDLTITTVEWSDTRGTGVTPHAVGAAITLPAGLMLANTSIIFAEVKYSFQSTLSTMIVGSVPLHAEAYQRPRLAIKVAK